MPRKTRVIVVGAGAIAQRRHLPEFAARDDVQLVAVVDANAKRARQVAAEFGVERSFKRLDDALALGADAVSVCTPNALHAAQSIAASRAAAHVLCEKPMAATVVEARAMIRAAKKARRQLMIAHNQRMAPAHVKAKEILTSGMVGECFAFSTSFAHSGPEGWSVDKTKGFFFKKSQAVLGALGDLGVHKIDLIRWLLDDEIVRVGAMYGTQVKVNCGVDDTAFATLKMAGGAMGQMYAGWGYTPPRSANATILHCTRGRIEISANPDFPVVVCRAGGERICIQPAANKRGSGIIDAFVDSIRSRRTNPIPGEQGARSLAAVLACMASGKTGRFVRPAKI